MSNILPETWTDSPLFGTDLWTDSPRSEWPRYLTDYSPSDKPWDVHRAQAQQVEGLYQQTVYDALARRIRSCSGRLGFCWEVDSNTGEARLTLRLARFCRVRHCPVCQWRRALMWRARFLKSLPLIEARYPTSKWVLLTLTVRNCPVSDLRTTLKHMNAAWQRLIKRVEFAANVQGWIRTTEVTCGQDGSAHPHFHCLLMVRPSYFTHNYVCQARWAELWRECARLDYLPVTDVRVVRARRGDSGESPLRRAVMETLKYSVKPSDLTLSRDWLLELTSQVYKLKFIASGGALKNILRENEESDEDLMLLGDDSSASDLVLHFEWRRQVKRYVEVMDKPISAAHLNMEAS
jgi:plasmid rolling circle replication initiator protein Rep